MCARVCVCACACEQVCVCVCVCVCVYLLVFGCLSVNTCTDNCLHTWSYVGKSPAQHRRQRASLPF
jgi:hypothetical protein